MSSRVRIEAQEAAKYIGVSYATLMRMVRNKQIPHVRIGTGERSPVAFFKDSLDLWMENLEKQSVAI